MVTDCAGEQQVLAATSAGAERLGLLAGDSDVHLQQPAILRARLASGVPIVDVGDEVGCSVVLYNAELAASGCLTRCGRALAPSSAFHAPLTQVRRFSAKKSA